MLNNLNKIASRSSNALHHHKGGNLFRNTFAPRVLCSANPQIYNRLYQRAVKMRKNPTPAEARMWTVLRGKKLGIKFRQQHIIDTFIVDFYCVEKGLVIEIDGSIHETQKDKDSARQAALESLGCSILRFTNKAVLHNLDDVIQTIQTNILLPLKSPLGD